MRGVIRIGVVASAVSVLFAVVVTKPMAGASMPQLTSTGSSASPAWRSRSGRASSTRSDGGNVNFAVSSSTIGLNDFCDQTVSFGASDLSYAAGQSDGDPTQVPYHYQYVPDVGGSLAFEYNLDRYDRQADQQPGRSTPRRSPGFSRVAISSWNDPAIVALNPNCEPAQRDDHRVLPCRPVRGELPAVRTTWRRPTRICWRPSSRWRPTRPVWERALPPPGLPFPNGTPAGTTQFPNLRGLDAVQRGPRSIPRSGARENGGIAFVESAYAKNVDLPVASVVNEAGNAVQPTAEDAAVALKGATLNPDLTENLSGVFDDTGRRRLSALGVIATW